LALSGILGCASTPPRTIDAARAEYPADSLRIGEATKSQIQAVQGSPAEIRKLPNGEEVYIYITNKQTLGISVDVGTTYIAEFTFDAAGKLKDKNYRAVLMGNPLVR
jgi:hypothetical protein